MNIPRHIVVNPSHDRRLEVIQRVSFAEDRPPRLAIGVSRSDNYK